MQFRLATLDDANRLAAMNQALIRDEGHRNPMSLAELEVRMAGWLAGEYRAAVFDDEAKPVGYALFRDEPDYVYLRQFYVTPERRRRRIGRSALEWLRGNVWGTARRLRVEVLIGNTAGIAFWRGVGFRDYCLTLELDAPAESSGSR